MYLAKYDASARKRKVIYVMYSDRAGRVSYPPPRDIDIPSRRVIVGPLLSETVISNELGGKRGATPAAGRICCGVDKGPIDFCQSKRRGDFCGPRPPACTTCRRTVGPIWGNKRLGDF